MKPLRIFIFFLAVLLLLLLISFLFPTQGISIGGDLRLSFLSVPDLFHRDSTTLPAEVEILLDASTVSEDPEAEPVSTELEVSPANVDSLKQEVYRIQLAKGHKSLLYPFFKSLDQIAAGSRPSGRIIHFGDSQIENDRMTALIRYRLQRNFGGTGSGLVQAIPLYAGSLSYEQEERGNWLRYTFFGKRDSTISHNSYGIMGAFASVPIPEGDDWPGLYYKFNTSRRSGKVKRVRLFMHSYVQGASVAYQANGNFSDTLSGYPDGFSVVDLSFPELLDDISIGFKFPEGGRIYGISFESEEGVQVDNVAMRGGSGLIFTAMDRSIEQAMLDDLSPDLILLQFGGNVVPYMSSNYYRRAFTRQLQFFKKVCPEIPVLVIGPSDMAFRKDGHFVTYPGLEGIRNALRDAALESGFGFWDLYEAMGGRNSMASFVHSDPPLASTDFVHFTNLGVNLVAEMFYNALMLEYAEFNHKNGTR